ncbi:MAG: GNAT family N-acetyltransferase [Alphaproteobacteria bacterium]|nr:GNAT family N-acetyltransferase [Alphaproteobacteria bacterium]
MWPFSTSPPGPVLRGTKVYLRPARIDDFKAWSKLRAESRAFLEPWEPSWSADELTRSSFTRRIRAYNYWAQQDLGHALFIFQIATNEMVGAISVGNIRRGAEQSGTLGYWIGARFAMQGYMGEALQLLCEHAFYVMGLHRLEAACLPRNAASKRLLETRGFELEGHAKSYIRIAGRWEDHLLFARLKTLN